MSSWDKINEEYNMTAEDWIEWKRTKKQYKNRTELNCAVCGTRIYTSPFVTFLILKGKKKLICSSCKEK